MDLKQLRTFRAVAELGSLSKAADRLRAAQPALSRHIKLLEHELRVELFVRNGRGMLLTSAGRMLLDRTTGLVRQIEQVRDDLQSASGKPSAISFAPRVARKWSAPPTVLASSTSQARAEGNRMQQIMRLQPTPVTAR